MRHFLPLRCLLVAAFCSSPLALAEDEDAPRPSKATPTPAHRKHSPRHRYPIATPSGSPKKQPFRATEDAATGKNTDGNPDQDAEVKPTPKKKAQQEVATPMPKPAPTKTPLPDPSASPSTTPAGSGHIAENASLDATDLTAFADQPAPIQRLLAAALQLTRQDLTYTYGSSDPANGGLDCSGFIYHVLNQEGLTDVPRDASGQYVWLRKAGTFRAVVGLKDSSFELNELRPGDLLFWKGTYSSQKDPPVTHTMIYLGREAKSGQRVMVGSSDGRSYEGKQRWGVSVFDFKMPGPASVQKGVSFIGYAHLPGLEKLKSPTPSPSPAETPSPTATPEAKPSASLTPKPTARPKAKTKAKTKRHRPRAE